MRRLQTRRFALIAVLAVGVGFTLGTAPIAAAGSSGSVKPNATNMLDCNGHSLIYKTIKANSSTICADPIHITGQGEAYRFYDNGHYVGHDEPSVKFISNAPGSAKDMTYYMRLATDPKGQQSRDSRGQSRTDYAQLSPAPWFGLPICDPKSYPQNPCAATSDTNRSDIHDPTAAGSAFLELQFYPPGYQPFVDAPSCDARHYCVAMVIWSLECTFGFAACNPNCIEPGNFAYLQTNGVPAGPPSPQLADLSSLTPNRHTLLMGQGDSLKVTIKDTSQGLLTRVDDLSSGTSGFMVASAANGFMNTNIQDCSGTPFSFHPEFNTALDQNQVPWAALRGGVLMEQEIGHFEACASVTNPLPVSFRYSDGQTFNDPKVYQTCVGRNEGSKPGEGPCVFSATGVACANATTEGNTPCPSNDPTSGNLCEYADAYCMPAGERQISVNGKTEEVSWPIAGCQTNAFQNGDLDFDGTPYQTDWPDGARNHPTSFAYLGPFDAAGHPYPSVQFETDLGGSEQFCNTETGAGCTVPPVGAAFYPYWSLGKGQLAHVSGQQDQTSCLWNFGNTIPGTTVNELGKSAQYGPPDIARYGGTFASAIIPNPQIGSGCGGEGDQTGAH